MKTHLLGAWSVALLAGAPTAFLACGGTTLIDVTEYDQTCQTDDECVVVRDGDICCGCPDAAINRSDLERYEGDLGSCGDMCDIGCNGTPEAFCDGGSCATRTAADQLCAPGFSVSCECADGAEGTKTCSEDGESFGGCVCA